MLERVMDMGTGVYILWGIGLLGLFLKMIASTYLKRMLRASENMSTTRKKSLRILRQKYENGRNLGINSGSGEAFVEKNIRGLRLMALPMEFWRRSGQLLACVACMLMAGGFLYYDVTWRGSPDMVLYLANGVLVCAFLLALENIFLVNNKLEMLKANIRDYLENLTPARTVQTRTAGRPNIRAVPQPQNPETDRIETEAKTDKAEKRQSRTAPAEGESAVTSVYDERASNSGEEPPQSNEEALNCFLKEFFS